jgi:plasmid stabilization system protein ParE
VRKIEWTPDGVDSLNEILVYYHDRAGENVASNIYKKIIKETELLEVKEIRTKQTPELKGKTTTKTITNVIKNKA